MASRKQTRAMGPTRDSSDPSSGDHLVQITQLKDKITIMEKQLILKDAQQLSKDKLITELKATHYTIEKEYRNKMKIQQRDHDAKVEMLSKKIKEQGREIAMLSKGKNKSRVSGQVTNKGETVSMSSTTDGGSSGTDSPSVN